MDLPNFLDWIFSWKVERFDFSLANAYAETVDHSGIEIGCTNFNLPQSAPSHCTDLGYRSEPFSLVAYWPLHQMRAWYIFVVVVVLMKGHREIKEPLSSSKVPETLIGPMGCCGGWHQRECNSTVSLSWGHRADGTVPWELERKMLQESKFRFCGVVVLLGQWRLAFRKPGACDYRTWFLKGQSATGEHSDRAWSKLPHAALWFLDVSQFNLLPFGFHFLKCMHWMTQSDLLDLLIFYRDIVECEPNIVDTWDLWPVINLIK